ncbi:MAG TPA: ABC transporter ATP-binding protein, partial [Anaerolineae bacterium]
GRVYKIRGAKKGDARELVALKDVDLEVRRGELFGLLGPNGAGKTTLIKILTTLLTPTSGRAFVDGLDVVTHHALVRERINMVSGGESSGYGLLTVRENLWMFAQFYGIDYATTYKRIDDMLEVVGLTDRKNTKISDLSTGLRQKMNIVRGFITDPEIIFLDEPTLGLDVGAARDVRQFVRRWMQNRGKALLLTTHYMVEADELCDRVAIIDKGQVLACDTPANLKRRLQREAIFRIETSYLSNGSADGFEAIPGVSKVTRWHLDDRTSFEFLLKSEDVLAPIVAQLTEKSAKILSLQKREPTLEDVFIDLVGRGLTDGDNGNGDGQH